VTDSYDGEEEDIPVNESKSLTSVSELEMTDSDSNSSVDTTNLTMCGSENFMFPTKCKIPKQSPR
jgi:hypothetical protein